MRDSFGRNIDYMRISITDRCNLRCKYCMPEGIDSIPMSEILTFEEIELITECAAKLGIRHIKVTGGEPLVRKGCCELIASLKAVPGIEKVTITTNGVLLSQYLDNLLAAGVDGINVSLDTTDTARYAALTGYDVADAVIASIKEASKCSVPVKMNAVSMVSQVSEWEGLLAIAKDYPVDVRFIEMMPIGYGKKFASVGNDRLLCDIRRKYPDMTEDHRVHGFGPAVYYQIPGFRGSVGFISAIHGKFCSSCNRVRLTSQGFLKTCLCYDKGANLREILRADGKREEKKEVLEQCISQAIREKPDAHCFEQPDRMTEQREMVMIGG